MKILTAGTKAFGKWWHEKIVTCGRCNQVVELQEGDEAVRGVIVTAGSVMVECSCCGQQTMIFEPLNHLVATKPSPTGDRLFHNIAVAQAAWMSGVSFKEAMQQVRET
jgi:hypothetical protein